MQKMSLNNIAESCQILTVLWVRQLEAASLAAGEMMNENGNQKEHLQMTICICMLACIPRREILGGINLIHTQPIIKKTLNRIISIHVFNTYISGNSAQHQSSTA